MYLNDDNTGGCIGWIDIVRTEGPDIMGSCIVRSTPIEVVLDTGKKLEFLAKDLYVDIFHNYHVRKFSEKDQGNRGDYYKYYTSKRCADASAQKAKEKSQNDILDEALELIGSAKNTITDLDKVRSNGLAFDGCQIDALIKLDYAINCIEYIKKNKGDL